jgi:hypothetical protein
LTTHTHKLYNRSEAEQQSFQALRKQHPRREPLRSRRREEEEEEEEEERVFNLRI